MLCLLRYTARNLIFCVSPCPSFFACQENCASHAKIGAVLGRSFSLFQSNCVRLIQKFDVASLIVGDVDRLRTDWFALSAFQSTKFTTVPRCTMPARSSASQLVSRMQPCDSVLPIFSGDGVPWMP